MSHARGRRLPDVAGKGGSGPCSAMSRWPLRWPWLLRGITLCATLLYHRLSTVVEYVDPAPVVPAPVTEYVATAPAVTYAASAPVVGYDAPALAVTSAPPAPVIGFVAPAPSVTYAAPAPVFEYVAPAPVFESIAAAPAVSFVAPSQQLRPAYTADSVTTGVNLDAEFVGSASQVVGSLPHGEMFAAPVFHQVHQEQLAGGEIPENSVEIPVVQKQVIVQASPHVVSAGDTAEDFTIFPVVQEQVLVGLRPAPPSEVAGPQGAAATGGYVGALLLAVLSLRGFDGVDDITAKFLLQQALVMKEKEEEERVKREQEQLKRQEDQEEARLTRLQAERDALLVLGLETLSSQQKKRLNAVLDEREAILDRWERRRVVVKAKEEKRRKKKKKKKKKLPKVSSHSSCGRARRRQRQWLGCIAGFTGDDVPRAWLLEEFHTSLVFMAVSVFCAMLGSHWIHAFWYVAMCVSTAPVAAHRDVVHSPFECFYHRCHCYCRGFVLSSADSLLRGCLRRDVVWWWIFLSWWCFDSIWDSVKPIAGNYLFYYFQYFQFVGCICMLNYWFSSFDEICPDFYYFSRFKLKDKCRSAKWELFLYGVMSIKVDRDRVEVVAQGCASALVLHPTWQRTTLLLCVVPAF